MSLGQTASVADVAAVRPEQGETNRVLLSPACPRRTSTSRGTHSSRPLIGSNVANKSARSITSFAAVFKALPRF